MDEERPKLYLTHREIRMLISRTLCGQRVDKAQGR